MLERIARELEHTCGLPVLVREPLAKHTSFRIGGPADLFVSPSTEEQICSLLSSAAELSLPVQVIGGGTNLLVRDGGVRGLCMHLGPEFAAIEVELPRIRAKAGARLSDVCITAADALLTGLEFGISIPGTLGGGLIMNAGAYGGCIGDVVCQVTAITADGEIRLLTQSECEFGYRSSVFRNREWIITEAVMELLPGDGEEIRGRHREICAKRLKTQPLDMPSAGSIFQRPPADYAGRLIEEAGLKGTRIGGALVSEKHANFIVNEGNATAANVIALMELVRERVYETQGVTLEPEIIVIGEG